MGNCQESKFYKNCEICCGTEDIDKDSKLQPEIISSGIQTVNLAKIRKNPRVIHAIIKLQSVYRGYRCRKQIRHQIIRMRSMANGDAFGDGFNGEVSGRDYRSEKVEQIRHLLGEFQFGTEDEQQSLRSYMQESQMSNNSKHDLQNSQRSNKHKRQKSKGGTVTAADLEFRQE